MKFHQWEIYVVQKYVRKGLPSQYFLKIFSDIQQYIHTINKRSTKYKCPSWHMNLKHIA
jgi:hypothetical protein